jgi:hypothetical protein
MIHNSMFKNIEMMDNKCPTLMGKHTNMKTIYFIFEYTKQHIKIFIFFIINLQS